MTVFAGSVGEYRVLTYADSPASSSLFANSLRTVARIAGPSVCGRPQLPLREVRREI